MTPSALQTRSTDALCAHLLLSLVYSVTRFRNRRLAHVASCQPDIGVWHRLYISALLWSQDSWLSCFIGTSYKDHQVKRRCVREKFTEWSLEVWMFKFYIKKCCIRRTCSSETKQNFKKHYVLVFKFLWILTKDGQFQAKDLPLCIWQRQRVSNTDTWNGCGKFGLYTRKNIFPETSKIRRNSGNPKKTEIPVFRILKKSIW